MKTAEYLLPHMDKLKGFMEMIYSYIEKGIEYIHWAKQSIEMVMNYIEKAIEYLSKYVEKKTDQLSEEHMFV